MSEKESQDFIFIEERTETKPDGSKVIIVTETITKKMSPSRIQEQLHHAQMVR
jgi:hypothetical protein